jgi:hypothetical protein
MPQNIYMEFIGYIYGYWHSQHTLVGIFMFLIIAQTELEIAYKIWPHDYSYVFLLQFVGLAYEGKDIVFRVIIKYSILSDFGP